jgi:hypothetical protein
MGDDDKALPVPPQLEAQLSKCRTMRELDYYKPRTKTAAVRHALFFVVIAARCSLLSAMAYTIFQNLTHNKNMLLYTIGNQGSSI